MFYWLLYPLFNMILGTISKEIVPTRLSSLQMPAARLGVPRATLNLTYDLLAINLGFPNTPKFGNLLERFRTLWKCYTYSYSFIAKGYKLELKKDAYGKVWEGFKHKASMMYYPQWHWSMALHRVLPTREAHWSLYVQSFYCGFIM